MTQNTQASEVTIEGFEQLREVVPGTRREIIQLERGQLTGRLLHAKIGDLPVDAVSFNLGVRSRGAYPAHAVTIGMLTASKSYAVHSAYKTRPGDIVLTPPGSEQENRYFGATSLIVTSLAPDDLETIYGGEAAIAALKRGQRAQFKGHRDVVETVIPRLELFLQRLKSRERGLTAQAAAYWKRAIVDAMLSSALQSGPAIVDGHLPSALKLVRLVEDFLDAEGDRAVHVSEICQTLRITRRTLHRAFHDAMGVGPIAYLRFKRLCSIHTLLGSGICRDRTIEDLAFQYGFLNPGRFAHYYRGLFGRTPAETRARL